MTYCILWISSQKRIFLLRHHFFDWLIYELEWYYRGHYLEVGVWYFLLYLGSGSGSLLTLWVHSGFQIIVKAIDVILEPCQWRWRSLSLWKRR